MTAAENCGINFVADYCSALSATATNKRPSCDGITSAPLSAARGDVFCRCWQHESFYKCRHVCELGILCDCTPYMLMHIYDFVFASLCAYIKRPLTAIGGSGGVAGVFALAAIQHSTFLCDIQYCDLRKPALQLALSLSLTFPLSLQPLSSSCHLPNSLCFCPFRPLSLYHSALFSYLSLGNHASPPPPQNPHFIFPPWVSKTFSTTLPSVWQRSPDEAPFSVLPVWTHILLLSWKSHNTVLVT